MLASSRHLFQKPSRKKKIVSYYLIDSHKLSRVHAGSDESSKLNIHWSIHDQSRPVRASHIHAWISYRMGIIFGYIT